MVMIATANSRSNGHRRRYERDRNGKNRAGKEEVSAWAVGKGVFRIESETQEESASDAEDSQLRTNEDSSAGVADSQDDTNMLSADDESKDLRQTLTALRTRSMSKLTIEKVTVFCHGMP
jgi:hypothetical protein